jgi:hypothetical protein
MTGLAHPPNRWDADTAKPGAGNTGLAASPEGLVNSQRKHPAMRSVRGLKDGCCVAARQERSWSGASALRWESEMDDRIKRYLADCQYAVAAKAMKDFARTTAFHFDDCESEIERLLMAAFLHLEALDRVTGYGPDELNVAMGPSCYPSDPLTFQKVSEISWAEMKAGFHGGMICAMTFITPQVWIGDYRVDFLIGHLECEPNKFTGDTFLDNWVVVECDGHDFHEKTKEQAQRDKARDRYLVSAGFKVMRFTGSEIWRDPTACAIEALYVAYPVGWWKRREGGEQ